jgi:hypothetical protein
MLGAVRDTLPASAAAVFRAEEAEMVAAFSPLELALAEAALAKEEEESATAAAAAAAAAGAAPSRAASLRAIRAVIARLQAAARKAPGGAGGGRAGCAGAACAPGGSLFRLWRLRGLAARTTCLRLYFQHSLLSVATRFDPMRPRSLRVGMLLVDVFTNLFVSVFWYSFTQWRPYVDAPPAAGVEAGAFVQEPRAAAAFALAAGAGADAAAAAARGAEALGSAVDLDAGEVVVVALISTAMTIPLLLVLDRLFEAAASAEFAWRYPFFAAELARRREAERRLALVPAPQLREALVRHAASSEGGGNSGFSQAARLPSPPTVLRAAAAAEPGGGGRSYAALGLLDAVVRAAGGAAGLGTATGLAAPARALWATRGGEEGGGAPPPPPQTPPAGAAADAAEAHAKEEASGWVDAPEDCARACPCLLRCCGRHPSQKAAFLAAAEGAAGGGAEARAAARGDPDRDEDSWFVETTADIVTAYAYSKEPAEVLSAGIRLALKSCCGDRCCGGDAGGAGGAGVAGAPPGAAAAAIEGELDANLVARRPCSCDGWLSPPAAAAAPGCTTPFALAAAAAGAWLIFCVYYTALFGLLKGPTATLTLLRAWVLAMATSYLLLQPAIIALLVLLYTAVLPAWLPYVRWLPLWGRLSGAQGAHEQALGRAHPLSNRLENMAYVEAVGSANKLPAGAALAGFARFATVAHVLGSAVGAPEALGARAAAEAAAGGGAEEGGGEGEEEEQEGGGQPQPAGSATENAADATAALFGAHYLLEQSGLAVGRMRDAGAGGGDDVKAPPSERPPAIDLLTVRSVGVIGGGGAPSPRGGGGVAPPRAREAPPSLRGGAPRSGALPSPRSSGRSPRSAKVGPDGATLPLW